MWKDSEKNEIRYAAADSGCLRLHKGVFSNYKLNLKQQTNLPVKFKSPIFAH